MSQTNKGGQCHKRECSLITAWNKRNLHSCSQELLVLAHARYPEPRCHQVEPRARALAWAEGPGSATQNKTEYKRDGQHWEEFTLQNYGAIQTLEVFSTKLRCPAAEQGCNDSFCFVLLSLNVLINLFYLRLSKIFITFFAQDYISKCLLYRSILNREN